MSITIQQLPITMLEEIVSDLDINEQVVLTKTNRYLNLIATPILYKDALFHFNFNEDDAESEVSRNSPQDLEANISRLSINDQLGYVTVAGDGQSVSEDMTQDLEVDIPRLDIHDQLDFASVAGDSENVEYEDDVNSDSDEAERQRWFELEPTIKKYNKFIFESQCINFSNLIAELESYSNLKRYKLTINTQQGFEQLKGYRGDKFKLMEMLELNSYLGEENEIRDIFHHLKHLKALVASMDVFYYDLKKFSEFSSDTLTYLKTSNIFVASTEFFYIVHRNFKNLKHLHFLVSNIIWDSSLTELPIFEKLLYLNFYIDNDLDPKVLNYMYNAKFWPKLKVLTGCHSYTKKTIGFEGQWNSLTTLITDNIDSTNLNHWNNFNQLQNLSFATRPRTDFKMLQPIFTNLTNLTTLSFSGEILSQHFDFLPNIRLRSLFISRLTDFSQPFVDFLKALVTIRTLQLYFTDNAFDGVNLNNLLNENHKFPSLRYVNLDNLPNQLQQWFSYSLNF